jgi:hypothetical protein
VFFGPCEMAIRYSVANGLSIELVFAVP